MAGRRPALANERQWRRSRRGAEAPAASAPKADQHRGAARRGHGFDPRPQLIRAYRVRGHLEADLDPAGPEADPCPMPSSIRRPMASPRPIWTGRSSSTTSSGLETATLREIIARCAPPIAARSASSTCISRIRPSRPGSRSASSRSATSTEFTAKGKRAILERLTAAEVFERFLDRKYTGTKRFGLDGGETADPGAGADPEARQPARRQRGGGRHGPSRPAQRAGQFHGQALLRPSSRSSRAIPPIPRTSRARPT